MSGEGFFIHGAPPPMCPKCRIRFAPGDTVENAPIEDGRDPETRQHVDCDNPQGAIDSKIDRAKKRLRGEQL